LKFGTSVEKAEAVYVGNQKRIGGPTRETDIGLCPEIDVSELTL